MNVPSPPIVLVIAGNDPTGGAGLCADIQALAYQGCHTAPVVTCITVQNTSNVLDSIPLSGAQILAQAETVLQDLPITICKIGLLGSLDIIEAVQQILQNHPRLQVILDPILVAGGGKLLAHETLREAMIQRLFPLTYLLTPNSQEALALTATVSLEEAALQLMRYGCQYVCITGTHENTPQVIHTLYGHGQSLESWSWPRLPDHYHGSGCTLASSIAGFLAQGQELITALKKAQHYTWTSLQQGFRPGTGQALPKRFLD